MRIGLYGGSFDPIHNAHLLIAQYVLEELSLEKVLFIPSGIPPHKKAFSRPEQRLQMVKLAIADNPKFEFSDFEIKGSGPSYSVNTIIQLRQQLGSNKSEMFWIMGSDNFRDFQNWKTPEKILELCEVVVFPRDRRDAEKFPSKYRHQIHYLPLAPLIEISSSKVRDLVRDQRSLRYWVPKVVESFILHEKIYT
ncbi:MAG: nicotinate (nicotinamide) nucleotide adenylyltransferase [bacterium]